MSQAGRPALQSQWGLREEMNLTSKSSPVPPSPPSSKVPSTKDPGGMEPVPITYPDMCDAGRPWLGPRLHCPHG